MSEEATSTATTVEPEDGHTASETATLPAVPARNLVEAEAAKARANEAFKAKRYQAAVDGYTAAIEFDPSNAIYYSNRAFAHIKLENYGAAVADATTAIEIDPKYVKGYYRRGDANFALGKFKLALKDLQLAAKVAPNDPDLKKKLTECQKVLKTIKFTDALSLPLQVMRFVRRHLPLLFFCISLLITLVAHTLSPVTSFWRKDAPEVTVSDTIDLATMPVEDSYTGAWMEGDNKEGYRITLEFVKAMMEEFKEQKLTHRRFAFEIVLQSHAIFKSLPSLVDVPVPDDGHITVCGDVHGQYYDLLNIFEINGLPSETNPYLFNGDFVDRGSFSLEVILTLLAFKVLYPQHMHLTRGNHESKAMNKIYGFDGEVRAKYNVQLSDMFRETFCWLPLAFVLNKRVMVVHGGLFSKDDVTLDEIRNIDRYREPPDDGVMCEALWSDPFMLPGRRASKRGVGIAFGPDITKRFLDRNNLELVVRSHEVKDEGYEVEHDGRLITVFSAPNYCDQMGNKGAFIRFNGKDMVPHFTQFSAVPHPDVKPMAYANQFMWGM